MKIFAMLHLYPPHHCAGAEMMTHTMLRELANRGHEVDVLLSQEHEEIKGPYMFEGVKVTPRRDKNDPFPFLEKANVVLTYLENTPRASVLARSQQIPLVHVLHNDHLPSKKWLEADVSLAVYNTEWMKKSCEDWLTENNVRGPKRTIVVHPPVFAEEYATTPGDSVTLINLYKPKGAELFYKLAKAFPAVPFLGVKGAYGEQVIENLPNVTIQEHTSNAKDDIYAKTRILLAPSIYESYGRVGVEAMCSGIPVIAHPTPGLKESLGDAGTFCDRDNIDEWVVALKGLLNKRKWAVASKKAKTRALELDPTEDLNLFCEAVEALPPRMRRL